MKGGDTLKKLMSIIVSILFALSMTGLCFAQAPAAAPKEEKKMEEKKPAKEEKKKVKKAKKAKKAKKEEKKAEEPTPAPEKK
jgi:Ni/Co efflux regulator RcnB